MVTHYDWEGGGHPNWASDAATEMSIEQLDPLGIGLRGAMHMKHSLDKVKGDAVEGLFQVEEWHVDWLAVFLGAASRAGELHGCRWLCHGLS